MLEENEVKLLNSFEVEELEERLEFRTWELSASGTANSDGSGSVTVGVSVSWDSEKKEE